MAIPANRNEVWQNMAKGLGVFAPYIVQSATGASAGNSGIGYYSVQINPNLIGSTVPGTLVDLEYPPALANAHLITGFGSQGARNASFTLARLYKFGTVDFTATGDKFTHDAATFPVLRKVYGQTSQPIALRPYLLITTTVGPTAVTFRMRTAAGGTGYVDQDGNNTVGTLTHTMPAASTGTPSGFYMRLESGDVGVRDISAVEITGGVGTTPTGAGTLYGMEPLLNIGGITALTHLIRDNTFAGLSCGDLAPAVATSGTASSILVIIIQAVTSNIQGHGWFSSVAAV